VLNTGDPCMSSYLKLMFFLHIVFSVTNIIIIIIIIIIKSSYILTTTI